MSRQGTKRQRTVQNVRNFWQQEGREWGLDPRVTIRDHHYRLLVKDIIVKIIKGRKRAIDLGCGTGFSSLYYAEAVRNLVGIDYVDSLIEYANKFLDDKKYFKEVTKKYSFDKKPILNRNLSFIVGDILDIKFSDDYFDVAITERVIVNLPNKRLQYKAILQVYRVLERNGIWVIAEASVQGNKKMNKLRKMFGLSSLEKYWHNLYLDEDWFENKVKSTGFKILKIMHFETYQFLTRIIHPMIIKPQEPDFLSDFNNAARIISKDFPDFDSISEIGLQKFLQKKFRLTLKKEFPVALDKYDQVIKKIIEINPNFKGCGNHILYQMIKTH